MPSLSSLADDVYTLTNRPDLEGETTLAIKNATLKAHRSDFFYKDLFETGIQFDFEQTQQTLDYKLLIPRWRAAKYLRFTDLNNCQGPFIDIITPDAVLDSYSINKENVAYVAGAEFKIRTCKASQYFLLGCYVFPDVTTDGYDSWIADEQPSAIVYEAAATIFKTIGFDEQTAMYTAMAQQERMELKMGNIEAVGY